MVNISGTGHTNYPNPSPKYTYTHTGATAADYYLRLYAPVGICHTFAFRVNVEAGPPPLPVLRLTGALDGDPLGPTGGLPLPQLAYMPNGRRATFAVIDGNGNPVPASFTLGTAQVQSGMASDALFPSRVIFRYTTHGVNDTVVQAVHLGTVQVTVVPNDPSHSPQVFTVRVQHPATLGQAHGEVDPLILPLAHEFGYSPQFFKAHVHQESTDRFDPLTYRYEPLSHDLNYMSRGQNLRRATSPYSRMRLQTAADALDTLSLPDGDLLIAADLTPRFAMRIQCTAANPQGRLLNAADVQVSAQEIYRCNNGYYNWSLHSLGAVGPFTRTTFTGQTSLAASYGYMQMTYAEAVTLRWTTATQPRNPSLLLDTPANHAAQGGSLRVACTKIRKDYMTRDPNPVTDPDMKWARFADFVEVFKFRVWRHYNRKTNYPALLAGKLPLYPANPARSLFLTEGLS